MSVTPLDILIRARDQASRVMNDVSRSGQRLDRTLDSSGKTTGRLGGFFSSTAGKLTGLIGGAYAARAAFDFGKEAIKNAEDAKRSMTAFHDSLGRTGQMASINEKKFNEWLQSMGESIGQDDEDLRDLATSLTSAFDFSKLKGDATENLKIMSRSIQDVAAATGKSSGLIKRSFLALANDPAAAVKQFQKLGVITGDEATKLKKLASEGKGAAVTQRILTLTAKQYGGAAEANTTASDKLAAVWENMKEALGNFLLPLFESAVDALSTLVSWFRNLADGVSGGVKPTGVLGMVFKALGDVWKSLQPLLQAIFQLIKKLWPAIKVVVGVLIAWYAIQIKIAAVIITIFAKALTLVIRLVTWVIDKVVILAGWLGRKLGPAFKVVADLAKTAWNGIKTVWNGAVNFFAGIGAGIMGVFKSVWNAIAGIWNSTIGALSFRVPSWVPGLGGKGFDMPNIPTFAQGGLVAETGLAVVHKGEIFSGINRDFGPFGKRGGEIAISIDRRRWVQQSEFETTYRGF